MVAVEPTATNEALIPRPADDDPEGDDHRMTIQEHLEELRNRLVISCAAILLGTIIAVPFTGTIFGLIRGLLHPEWQIISSRVVEGFMTYLWIDIWVGLGLATPIIVYQIAMFVAPALTRDEKRFILKTLPGVFFCFVLGVVFAYFLVIPNALNFLVAFGHEHLGITPLIDLEDFINFVLALLFWVGVSFETPVIVVALKKIGLLNDQRMKTVRKYFIVFAFVAAAFITPTPDPVNQIIIAVPIIILYEIGVLIAKLV